MKKIFYSLMAVALCSCAQSDVEDVVTPPQPENKGARFEVVDNGFTYEDGTRVEYGEYGSDGAYTSTFVEGDAIGVYAIKSSKITKNVYDGLCPDNSNDQDVAYTVSNAKLTLTNGTWTGDLGNIGEADLLFAYAPYRENVNLNDGEPAFTKNGDKWEIFKGNNRFFVHPWTNRDNGTLDKFKAADWMGAVVNNLTEGQKAGTEKITFKMQHMRGMIELIIDENVELSEVKYGGYVFTPYFFNESYVDRSNKKVYRILTTEYRNTSTLNATIKDGGIIKKFGKEITAKDPGHCARVTIGYTPAQTITVNESESLAAALTEIYDTDYATDPALTTLRLAGTLNDDDWTTLGSLTKLTALDMSQLGNKSIPDNWLKNAQVKETLYSLALPNGLTTIGTDALQTKKINSIELPASVTTIGIGAFYGCNTTSIRIPEDSQLQTVGNGAFNSAKAVYTYEGNTSLLVLPTSLTSIGTDYAFYVTSLEKIIFMGETAPTTIGALAFDGINAEIFVPKKEGYAGNFPGKTVYARPTLTAENYASPYTIDYDGIGIPGLCDNDYNTFWHTPWSGESAGDITYGQYIDITLPEGKTMSSLLVKYATRHNNSNAVPEIIDIYTGTDGQNWTKIVTLTKDGNGLPTEKAQTYTSDLQTATTPFTKIRFAITKSKQGSLCGTIPVDNNGYAVASTSLGELEIYEDIWTESASEPTPAN